MGLKVNRPYNFDYMSHNLSFNASSQVSSNFTDTQFIKSKLFLRYNMLPTKSTCLQTSVSAGFINNLSGNMLKVNDQFYLKNFKGIRNIGYYFD